ncbi:Uma2 family endonuclease [Streptosporangium sp. NPDC004379]|uniref:Uma2 family endonuclease n=1 Tax=Streptosporangium sp. NPDC004379 TaxID=3366189 RepID=UPI0036845DE0
MAKALERPAAESAQEDDLEKFLPEMQERWPDRRVELINGRIVVRELPSRTHNTIVFWILGQIFGFVTERGWLIWNDIMLHLGTQSDRYRPDLTIVPAEPRMWDQNEVHGDSTLLVVEVVSSSSSNDDHVVKPRNCGRAGVPLYLVIDTFQKQIRLLSGPGEAGYTQEVVIKFGAFLDLPAPWDLTIDTSKLVNE